MQPKNNMNNVTLIFFTNNAEIDKVSVLFSAFVKRGISSRNAGIANILQKPNAYYQDSFILWYKGTDKLDATAAPITIDTE